MRLFLLHQGVQSYSNLLEVDGDFVICRTSAKLVP